MVDKIFSIPTRVEVEPVKKATSGYDALFKETETAIQQKQTNIEARLRKQAEAAKEIRRQQSRIKKVRNPFRGGKSIGKRGLELTEFDVNKAESEISGFVKQKQALLSSKADDEFKSAVAAKPTFNPDEESIESHSSDVSSWITNFGSALGRGEERYNKTKTIISAEEQKLKVQADKEYSAAIKEKPIFVKPGMMFSQQLRTYKPTSNLETYSSNISSWMEKHGVALGRGEEHFKKTKDLIKTEELLIEKQATKEYKKALKNKPIFEPLKESTSEHISDVNKWMDTYNVALGRGKDRYDATKNLLAQETKTVKTYNDKIVKVGIDVDKFLNDSKYIISYDKKGRISNVKTKDIDYKYRSTYTKDGKKKKESYSTVSYTPEEYFFDKGILKKSILKDVYHKKDYDKSKKGYKYRTDEWAVYDDVVTTFVEGKKTIKNYNPYVKKKKSGKYTREYNRDVFLFDEKKIDVLSGAGSVLSFKKPQRQFKRIDNSYLNKGGGSSSGTTAPYDSGVGSQLAWFNPYTGSGGTTAGESYKIKPTKVKVHTGFWDQSTAVPSGKFTSSGNEIYKPIKDVIKDYNIGYTKSGWSKLSPIEQKRASLIGELRNTDIKNKINKFSEYSYFQSPKGKSDFRLEFATGYSSGVKSGVGFLLNRGLDAATVTNVITKGNFGKVYDNEYKLYEHDLKQQKQQKFKQEIQDVMYPGGGLQNAMWPTEYKRGKAKKEKGVELADEKLIFLKENEGLKGKSSNRAYNVLQQEAYSTKMDLLEYQVPGHKKILEAGKRSYQKVTPTIMDKFSGIFAGISHKNKVYDEGGGLYKKKEHYVGDAAQIDAYIKSSRRSKMDDSNFAVSKSFVAPSLKLVAKPFKGAGEYIIKNTKGNMKLTDKVSSKISGKKIDFFSTKYSGFSTGTGNFLVGVGKTIQFKPVTLGKEVAIGALVTGGVMLGQGYVAGLAYGGRIAQIGAKVLPTLSKIGGVGLMGTYGTGIYLEGQGISNTQRRQEFYGGKATEFAAFSLGAGLAMSGDLMGLRAVKAKKIRLASNQGNKLSSKYFKNLMKSNFKVGNEKIGMGKVRNFDNVLYETPKGFGKQLLAYRRNVLSLTPERAGKITSRPVVDVLPNIIGKTNINLGVVGKVHSYSWDLSPKSSMIKISRASEKGVGVGKDLQYYMGERIKPGSIKFESRMGESVNYKWNNIYGGRSGSYKWWMSGKNQKIKVPLRDYSNLGFELMSGQKMRLHTTGIRTFSQMKQGDLWKTMSVTESKGVAPSILQRMSKQVFPQQKKSVLYTTKGKIETKFTPQTFTSEFGKSRLFKRTPEVRQDTFIFDMLKQKSVGKGIKVDTKIGILEKRTSVTKYAKETTRQGQIGINLNKESVIWRGSSTQGVGTKLPLGWFKSPITQTTILPKSVKLKHISFLGKKSTYRSHKFSSPEFGKTQDPNRLQKLFSEPISTSKKATIFPKEAESIDIKKTYSPTTRQFTADVKVGWTSDVKINVKNIKRESVGATQSLFRASNIKPSVEVKGQPLYGFDNVYDAKVWAHKYNYKNIYQFTTNKYSLDTKTYIRGVGKNKYYSKNEFIVNNILSDKKIGVNRNVVPKHGSVWKFLKSKKSNLYLTRSKYKPESITKTKEPSSKTKLVSIKLKDPLIPTIKSKKYSSPKNKGISKLVLLASVPESGLNQKTISSQVLVSLDKFRTTSEMKTQTNSILKVGDYSKRKVQSGLLSGRYLTTNHSPILKSFTKVNRVLVPLQQQKTRTKLKLEQNYDSMAPAPNLITSPSLIPILAIPTLFIPKTPHIKSNKGGIPTSLYGGRSDSKRKPKTKKTYKKFGILDLMGQPIKGKNIMEGLL